MMKFQVMVSEEDEDGDEDEDEDEDGESLSSNVSVVESADIYQKLLCLQGSLQFEVC